MKMLITGGAGFIGSHAAEYFANKGYQVRILDNLSRTELLKKENVPKQIIQYNWNYLKSRGDITLIKGDIQQQEDVETAAKGVDVIIHAAAQTAVTTSMIDPRTDFLDNALGTFNVLEAARQNNSKLIYCSTNKVYGDNVNKVELEEGPKHYSFKNLKGISEKFSIDLCEHTPYGCSKLTGDLYVQDYAHHHDLNAAVFRMSCIYGTRQMGFEDQGWIAWFTIAALTNQKITIYGDGKQVRDVLYVSDLLNAYDSFLESNIPHGVYNLGGGPTNTLSLLELVDRLEHKTGEQIPLNYQDWRPSDQKVYISDIDKAKKELHWTPQIKPEQGLEKLIDWVETNKSMFTK